jgi:hypothetical protein
MGRAGGGGVTEEAEWVMEARLEMVVEETHGDDGGGELEEDMWWVMGNPSHVPVAR